MERRWFLAGLRAAFALLVVVAILVQIDTNIGKGGFNPTRFFAFFTILSNIFGATLMLVLAARRRRAESMTLDVLRGASVVYLTVTFFVVIILLSGADLQVAVPWVDAVLHKIFPVFVVIDWLIDPPRPPLRVRRALLWLVPPAIWITLTLARGAADGWYPYPFLDPADNGYGAVALTSAAILIGFIVVCGIALAAGNAMSSRRHLGAAAD